MSYVSDTFVKLAALSGYAFDAITFASHECQKRIMPLPCCTNRAVRTQNVELPETTQPKCRTCLAPKPMTS